MSPNNSTKSKSKNELKKITKRPLAYVASPYGGDIENNTMKARAYCAYVDSLGFIPIAPHLLFPQFIPEGTRREDGLYMALNLLNRCEHVFFFGSKFSEGMKAEYKKAVKTKHKENIFKITDKDIKDLEIIKKFQQAFPERK